MDAHRDSRRCPASRSSAALRLPAAAVLLVATAAEAQLDDHLQCFKIKDAKTFSSATVDLDSQVPLFGLQSCTVKGRAKELCVPADKSVVEIQDGSLLAADGDAVLYSRLCYKLKCPRVDYAPEQVRDQFGHRSVEKFKAVKLCTPAVLDAFPVGPTTTTTSTTTTTTTTTTVPSLDDTFDGGSLDPSWNVLNPGLVDITVSGGALHLVPTAAGGTDIWFNDGQGPLVYKDVTGDFDVAAVVEVEDSNNPGSDPPETYRLAGILARDPASGAGDRNTVHTALGSGGGGQGVCYEYKTTDGSVSTWLTTPTPGGPDRTGEVRLTRTGTMVRMYWRPDSGPGWTEIHSVNRPDLPATVQVGPMVYSASAPPSIRASFLEITGP